MRGSPVEESTTVPVAVTVWADALKEPVIMTSADKIISSEPLQNPFDISFAINLGFGKFNSATDYVRSKIVHKNSTCQRTCPRMLSR